ncbi:heme biosynthesis protein HemY [Pseudochelatococcus lubricantis]|uniref:heme biosynthesis protein HemY n=1 Tax=Pseudochelatococcus lubricantis TaxID=1538102 RepID=UPI0035E59533
MVRLVGFILIVALIALGIGWLADRPGDVAVVWQGYRIETSVVVALAAVAATTLALALIWAVLRYVFGLPSAISFSSRARRRTKGVTSVSRGLIAVGTGDAVSARRHAAEAERLLGREPLTLLLKAQAAQMAGDRAGAETAFHLMLDTPDTRVLGLRGLFVEARRKGDAVAARAYAQKASELAPKVAWASEAVLEYQSADRDWRGALATLDRQTRQKAISRDAARRLRAVLLTADALARQEREPGEALVEVKEAVKLAPGLVPAAVLAGRLLSREGSLRKAARILETAWKLAPHPDIAAAYVDLRPGDSARDRHERAEALARLVPHHPESRLIRAATALETQDFARARMALTPLLEEYPTVRTCLLMADIAEAEHGAGGEWREWIGRASRARRDPAWIADGVVSETWQPVSPVTGRLDAFVWSAPVEQIGEATAEERAPAEAAPVSPASLAMAGAAAPAVADSVLPSTPEVAPPVEIVAAPVVPAPAEIPLEEAPAGTYPETLAEPIAPAAETPVVPETPAAPEPEEPRDGTPAPAGQDEAPPEQAKKGVVFPLDHAPDDPGPDAPEEIVQEPVRVNLAGRAP